jgi:hypothetical protein
MWTKAEIAKLTVEQQEVLARFELSIARRRQKLLEEARGLDWRSRYWPLYPFAMFMIFVVFYCFDYLHFQENPGVLYLVAGMMAASRLILYITGINRRLNALLELLDLDHKIRDDRNNSKDEKAG